MFNLIKYYIMGRRALNLTPEEVEERRQRRILRTKVWAFEHPELCREWARTHMRNYYQANKERLNAKRAEQARNARARAKAAKAAALVLQAIL